MKYLIKKIFMIFATMGAALSPLACSDKGGGERYELINIADDINEDKSSKKSHYFYIMIDSLMSQAIYDSLWEMEQMVKNSDKNYNFDASDLTRVKNSLKDFKLLMNVTTTGYATETGLPGIMGGPAQQSLVSQFSRDTNLINVMNNSWEGLLNDLSSSDKLEKIYLSNMEFYKSTFPQDNTGFVKGVEYIDNLVDPEHKVELLKFDSQNRSNESIINVINQMDFSKNTASIVISNLVHDVHHESYASLYSRDNSKRYSFFNFMINLVESLKKLNKWDNSEIIIVSDHGKYMSNDKIMEKDTRNFKEASPILKEISESFSYKELKATLSDDNIVSIKPGNIVTVNPLAKVQKTEKVFWNKRTYWSWDNKYGKHGGLQERMSSILYKPLGKSTNTEMQIDWKNIYSNFDAPAILYHDLQLDDSRLKFNFYKYVPGLNATPNNNGDLNSYVADPLNKDLSKRRLISMNRDDVPWGLQPNLKLGKDIIIYDGPLLNFNQKPLINDDSISFFKFDKNVLWKIVQKKLKESIDDSIGYKTFGSFLLQILNLTKSH